MIRQADVENAFLNGHIKKCVFIEQPPGFNNPEFSNHMCHLKHALYDLKQAPRVWFERLWMYLIDLGFLCSKSGSSLFTLKSQLRHR